HWPAQAMEHPAVQAGDAPKPGEIAGPDAANNRDAQPGGLTLEKLRLSFVDNIYFAGAGQGWFEWGITWGRHKSYSNLSDFQTGLGLDKGGRVLDPAFANLNALDCRLKPVVMAALRQSYPKDPVPGVILGEQQ